MSLRHALLGLLAGEPASGYDLSRRFEGDLGRYAWSAGHTRIYPELVAMEREGLVTVVATGARGRKTYAATDRGQVELRSWLMAPTEPGSGQVRNELVLRMFLLSSVDRADARALLEGIAGHCAEELDRIRPVMADLDARSAPGELPFGRLAGEYGMREYEALRAWALWSLERLSAS